MKNERLYAAIGAADDELLFRCEAEVKKPKTAWIKYGSLAACAAAVLLFCVERVVDFFALFLNAWQNRERRNVKQIHLHRFRGRKRKIAA
jgi:hypothetical protein